MALSTANTCKQGRQAWIRLAPAPSASAVVGGVGWYGRTATQKTPAEQQREEGGNGKGGDGKEMGVAAIASAPISASVTLFSE